MPKLRGREKRRKKGEKIGESIRIKGQSTNKVERVINCCICNKTLKTNST